MSTILFALLLAVDIRIEGPKQINPGDLCILTATGNGKSFAWSLPGSDKTFLPVEGGRRCVFACGTPGRYTFVCATAAKDECALAVHTLEVGTPPPGPGPGPLPTPPGPGPTPPDPTPKPPPDGKYGIAPYVWREASKLPTPAKTKTTAVAAAFKSTAAAISAGTIGLLKIPAETRKAFDAAVGDQKPAWSALDVGTQAELKKLAAAGKITTKEQLAEAYVEIAIGLEAVK